MALGCTVGLLVPQPLGAQWGWSSLTPLPSSPDGSGSWLLLLDPAPLPGHLSLSSPGLNPHGKCAQLGWGHKPAGRGIQEQDEWVGLWRHPDFEAMTAHDQSLGQSHDLLLSHIPARGTCTWCRGTWRVDHGSVPGPGPVLSPPQDPDHGPGPGPTAPCMGAAPCTAPTQCPWRSQDCVAMAVQGQGQARALILWAGMCENHTVALPHLCSVTALQSTVWSGPCWPVPLWNTVSWTPMAHTGSFGELLCGRGGGREGRGCILLSGWISPTWPTDPNNCPPLL